MVQALPHADTGTGDASLRDLTCRAYRWMLLARVLDDKFASMYRAGKMHGGVFLGRGQEALSVSVGVSLRRGDIFAPLIRDLGGRLAFGEPILDGIRNYLGSVRGPMRGRDGNVHRGRPREGLLPMISHLGAMISVVNGTLMARRFKGDNSSVGATCVGEGATSTGSFHEALNQAAIEKLPLIMVVANNQYAYSTPSARQFACHDLVERAAGYGVNGVDVDGTSLADCLAVVGAAVGRARQGGGPQLIVARLLRLCGHGEHDDASYVDPALKSSSLGRDCMDVARDYLVAQSWADADTVALWKQETINQVNSAVAKVQQEPTPDPFAEDWCAVASRHLMETFEE